jgi:Protein of unknown function (DUF3047)
MAPHKTLILVACAVIMAGCATTALQQTEGPEPRIAPAAGPIPTQALPTHLPALVPPAARLADGGGQYGAAQSGGPAGPIAPGWEPYILHRIKKNTNYVRTKRQGKDSIRADAQSSASGWLARVSIDPLGQPLVSWSWKVQSLIAKADNTQRESEDSPVRLVLAFDGDKSSLPFKEQAFFERAKLLGGRELPYATLMYIWENQAPVGSIIPNPHTSRIQKLVAESGPERVGQWLQFERNIVQDFQQAFGEMPGRLIGVAILTDTDNTRSKVTAWYGNIELKPQPVAQRPTVQ